MILIFIIEALLLYGLKKVASKENNGYVYSYKFIDEKEIDTYRIVNYDLKSALKTIYTILWLIFAIVIINPTGLAGIGEVFVSGDSVISWNRWAVEIATTGEPSHPNRYPELIPSILSIPYVFMNNVWIQFFSYAIMLFFPSCLILTCISIYHKFPLSALFSAILLFLWPIKKFVHYAGYADIPVATFSFMAISALIWGYKENESIRKKCLIISAFFLGAACETKQSGIILLFFYPLFILEFNLLKLTEKKLKLTCIVVLILILTALPWNLYNEYLVRAELSVSNLDYLTQGIHLNRSFAGRFFHAAVRFPGIFIAILLTIPGLFVSNNKIFSLFGIFYFIVWGLFFSYDARNFYIAIPFVAFSAGLTTQNLLITKNNTIKSKFIDFNILSSHKKMIYVIIAILITVSFSLLYIKSDKINIYLNKRQDRKLLLLGYHKADNVYIVNNFKPEDNFIFLSNNPDIQYLTKYMKDRVFFYFPVGDVNYDINQLNSIASGFKDKDIFVYLDDRARSEFVSQIGDKLSLVYSGNGVIYRYNNGHNATDQ